MKVICGKMSEMPHYQTIMDSCVTEEMMVPNTKDVKIIIHTPKSLLDTKVDTKKYIMYQPKSIPMTRAEPVWCTPTEEGR